MSKRIITVIVFLLTSAFSPSILAQAPQNLEQQTAKYAYFTLEPDITTNVSTQGNKLGYLRVRIDVMVNDPSDLALIEHHQPLIRDTIINLLGQQSMEVVSSLAGREQLRHEMVRKVNAILLPELGRTIVSNLLFTKYLYQQ